MEQALADVTPRIVVERTDVFAVSEGLSRRAWEIVRRGYFLAGRGGAAAALYRWARRNASYERPSPLMHWLGRDLRRWAGSGGVVVVDHPAVAGALRGRPDVWYMHGEMAAPPEAFVRSASRIFVPLEETAEVFVQGGVDRDRLVVTGVCIERGLLSGAVEAIAARRERLAGNGPLTIAFFSSGAEPVAHVRALAVGSCAIAHERAHRAVVFAKWGGRLEAAVRAESQRTGAEPQIVFFRSRGDLDEATAQAFPSIDLVVSPPHERSNWAVALGVPFFLVGPDLGPFAPRNRALLKARGVAAEIQYALEAVALPARIARMRREGLLAKMSARATGPDPGGFAVVARSIALELERREKCRST